MLKQCVWLYFYIIIVSNAISFTVYTCIFFKHTYPLFWIVLLTLFISTLTIYIPILAEQSQFLGLYPAGSPGIQNKFKVKTSVILFLQALMKFRVTLLEQT